MDPILIIGTGLAGYGTARELRKHDKDTPIVFVTRDDGASYYKPDLSEAHAKGQTPEDLIKKSAEEMAAELDAQILTHRQVESIDPAAREVRLNGDTLKYSKLVLAFGADPIVLQLGGDATQAVHKINNLADYRTFRRNLGEAKHIAVLGAGLIGCEFANDLLEAGYKVSVADPAGWPLSQLLPEACGKAVKRELAHAGVDWYLDHAAVAVHESGKQLEVVLDNDDTIRADIVLSAVGLRAGVEIADKAGLTVDRGIVVDRSLRTSDPHIYALGDCAEVDGHWRPYVGPLMQCARTLGKTLAGGAGDTPGQVKYPTLPIIVKTHVCPVIVYPPVSTHGEWRIEGKSPNLEAAFVDADGQMLGFALIGEATNKRRDYLKDAPPLME
ncbi:NAD(P)/FAD-dependent oxidoreductase [Salinisphaera aquimarina]|uniref:NAD(P)/FAD-dependent oxidoreductase n=1 Tax=Salinisphaera aquimarina TaxID=2094031 RepID=A0ABV7EMS4_9GAMM